MAKESAKNCLFKLSNNASPPVFTAVGGQENTQWQGSANPIDVSDKTTDGWGATITGTKAVTLTVSGFPNWPDTAGFQALRTAWENDQTVTGRAVFNSSGNHYEGEWSVTGFDIGGAHDAATGYTFTLQNAGALTYAATE